jgi:CDP-diacylglycerol--serine O-phosphatidyltransferase
MDLCFKTMKKHLPNILTLTNLFFGCLAVVSVSKGYYDYLPLYIFASLLADFGDGWLARKLEVKSDIGLQLDSLADMVTFGLTPGVVMVQLLTLSWQSKGISDPSFWLISPGLFLTLFSALRLAKFNIDERQTNGFLGLATPADAAFIIGLLLIATSQNMNLRAYILQPYLLYFIIILSCFLMVSEIPMFSLKFSDYKVKGNIVRYTFLLCSVVFLIFLGWKSASFIILLYIILSIMLNLQRK